MHRVDNQVLLLPLSAAQAVPQPRIVPRRILHTAIPLLLLVLITIFGGGLRFYRLTYPPLWNDESLVYWRTCGTYAQMLEPLRHDMFYELQQWLPMWTAAMLAAGAATLTLVALVHKELRPALFRLIQMLLAIGGLYAGCWVIFLCMFEPVMMAMLRDQPMGSVWEPRYLGIVWPPFGIAAAVLLMRLPTRPVRIACIFFVLAVNLVMAGLRMVLTTEPPIDLLAKDIWASQGDKANVRTFDFIQGGDIAVAGSSLSPWSKVASGRYYLEMESNHQPISPDIFEQSLQYYNRSFMAGSWPARMSTRSASTGTGASDGNG